MNQFHRVWSKASEALQSKRKSQLHSKSQDGSESEDATMKAAGKLASAAGPELSCEEKARAGPVHGADIELASRKVRRNPELAGMGFETVLFAGADEIAIPALRLDEKAHQDSAVVAPVRSRCTYCARPRSGDGLPRTQGGSLNPPAS
jgi:hypothetical protein